METILLVLALSLDAFVACIAYGTYGIKIPFKSISIINLVCTFFLSIALFFGRFLGNILPQNINIIISSLILMGIGIYYLFESLIKNYLKKRRDKDNKLKFRFFNISFIIEIYIDETKADMDNSKSLNPTEALYLALALSLDSIAIGFGSGLVNISFVYIIFLSLIMGLIAMGSGLFLGRLFAEKSKLDLSWLTGIILILLALMKLHN